MYPVVRLSPELYLKRPVTPNQEWRLDLLLKRKAVSGHRTTVVQSNVGIRTTLYLSQGLGYLI